MAIKADMAAVSVKTICVNKLYDKYHPLCAGLFYRLFLVSYP